MNRLNKTESVVFLLDLIMKVLSISEGSIFPDYFELLFFTNDCNIS